ncbi:hypothetical protein HS041_07830 [Planomonospora sp. ID67723]|uniref:hypothetical protein n=1 Tax=Planomonospora sp. ID67723 TaxID=2738134 RepID=UPI0018C43BB4|nr:hypothetical protein [Planomonospora sp. ID67723]MBG0827670.1 hypothetical protein [Planomonospora sp. ID67723]
MKAIHDIIPTEHAAFFEAVKQVFEQYPEAKGKYAVASLELQTEMGIDYDTKEGLSRIEGDQIITRFVDRDDAKERARVCTLWNWDYSKCLHWKEAEM